MVEIEPVEILAGSSGQIVLIAGPCSAESQEQVIGTARALARGGVRIFRAGIWKPRTKPGCFEGIGSQGLEWLEQVKRETGMYVTTEVANSRHVEEALSHGIDILWIGARTTANPFAVQEIADSLRGTDIPGMVKNPVNPDIDLWIGAMERLNKSGIRKLAAIHRGFSTYGEKEYRNAPQWQIPIELRRRIPRLPILCDPSHMGGRRDLVLNLSQQALNLDADGLFVEVHNNPECALSDAAQQLTPACFFDMAHNLVRRRQPDLTECSELSEFRKRIDECDRNMLRLISERLEISSGIGMFKKEHNLTVLQSERYNDIIEALISDGERIGISRECIREVFESLHYESIRKQSEIMK